MTNDPLVLELYQLVNEYVPAPIEKVLGKDALRGDEKGGRKANVVTARNIIARLLRLIDKEKYHFKKIGQELGGRDHTTIVHSLKTLNNQIEKELKTRELVYKLEFFILNKYTINNKILSWEKRTDEFGNLILQG